MSDAPELLVEDRNGVRHLTLNRADAANALTQTLRDELIDAFLDASSDLAVRAVLLTAAGEKAFCTGADLRGPRSPKPRPEGAPDQVVGDVARMIKIGWQRLVASILDCEKPVVAAVNGTAAGGGMHLALACDLVLASDTARFIEVFVRRGLVPDAGGAYLLPRLVGLHKARELMYFGDDLAAADAERIGLINRCVPAAELMATATEWAERLAKGPTKSIGYTKALLNRSLDVDRATAFTEEGWAQEQANRSEDFGEGMRAFMERRPPEFRGW